MKFVSLNTQEVLSIRHEVLRPGKPSESACFDGDTDPNTLHFGIILENKVVCVVSILPKHHEKIEGKIQFQLRGMATLEKFQKKGIGSFLLENVLKVLKMKNTPLILWCNVRVEAISFYQKFDFEIIGKTFWIEKIGLHTLMLKKIP